MNYYKLRKRSTNFRKRPTSKINTKANAKKPTRQAVLIRNKIQSSMNSNKTDENRKWNGLMRNSVFLDRLI